MELADAVLSDALAVRGQTGRETRRSDTTQAHRGAVDAARHIMAARYSDRLLIDEIAHAVHLSPFHLSRVFRRETGLPLHRYATSLRLRAALDRLADRRVDLTMLALDLGFSSYNHFSTAFRRAFNLSPAAFRRNLTSSRMREMSKIVGV
jgi:AraC-like DNA-binding protein